MFVLSRFTKTISIDEQTDFLYNTLTRKYYAYPKTDSQKIGSFLANLNKDIYSEVEAKLLLDLNKDGIIVDDKCNELIKLEWYYNRANFEDNSLNVTVYATNACNFRCTYCTQEHITKNLTDETISSVIALFEKEAPQRRRISLFWFGGEPMIQYGRMLELSKKCKEICDENGCGFSLVITSNGYLFDEKRFDELMGLNLSCVQITVDGCKSSHDERRVLADGKGTYDTVMKNLIMGAEKGAFIDLRINVDEENYNKCNEVLDSVPRELRHNVMVSVSNIHQNKNKISTFEIYKYAIENGFNYAGRKNCYQSCPTCGHYSIVIDSNGDVKFCTCTEKNTPVIGKLKENGKVAYKPYEQSVQNYNISGLDNKKCRECAELPLCISRCRLEFLSNRENCLGMMNDGLSLEERAKLDHCYDQTLRRN